MNVNKAEFLKLSRSTQMTLQDLVEYYNLAHYLDSADLKKRALTQITPKMNKVPFKRSAKLLATRKLIALKMSSKKYALVL